MILIPCMLLALGVQFGLAASPGQEPVPEYGDIQLEVIMRDRPAMRPSIETRPAIREWIVECFNQTVPPIRWDPSPPVSGRRAEFDATDPETTRVRVSTRGSGIDQLCALLFELHNIGRYEQFEAVHISAVRGELSRETYAEMMLEQEFLALMEARAFLANHVGELSRQEHRAARIYWPLLEGPETLEEHVQQFLKKGVDLRDHFRELYDTEVIAEREAGRGEP